jgi:hypothetical protein
MPENGTIEMMERMQTPWGQALTKLELTTGVFWVETGEQGGVLIERAQAITLLSDPARKIGQPWENYLAYEEVHDMPVIFYEHAELYPWVEEELTEKLAADALRRCHPEYFHHE